MTGSRQVLRRLGMGDLLYLALLFYLGIAPAGKHNILIPMLGAAGLLGGFVMLTRADPGRKTRNMVALFAVPGAINVTFGIILDTPGWLDVSVPLVFGPIAWFGISFLAGHRSLGYVPLAIALSGLGVVALVLGTILNFQVPLLSALQSTAVSGVNRVNLTAATALIVTIPFMATYLIEAADNAQLPWRKVTMFALGATLLAAAASGRQSVFGTALLSPLLAWFIRHPRMLAAPIQVGATVHQRFGRLFRFGLIGASGAAGSAIVLSLLGRDIVEIADNLLSSLGLLQAETTRIANAFGTRSRQHSSLLAGFFDSPVWGNGAGAVSPDYLTWRVHRTRVAERPWRVELQYHLMLFEGGLLLAGLYWFVLRASFKQLRRTVKTILPHHAAIVRCSATAALALAIATASNPYVRGVGQQWALFAPFTLAAAAAAAPALRQRSSSGELDPTGVDEQPIVGAT